MEALVIDLSRTWFGVLVLCSSVESLDEVRLKITFCDCEEGTADAECDESVTDLPERYLYSSAFMGYGEGVVIRC